MKLSSAESFVGTPVSPARKDEGFLFERHRPGRMPFFTWEDYHPDTYTAFRFLENLLAKMSEIATSPSFRERAGSEAWKSDLEYVDYLTRLLGDNAYEKGARALLKLHAEKIGSGAEFRARSFLSPTEHLLDLPTGFREERMREFDSRLQVADSVKKAVASNGSHTELASINKRYMENPEAGQTFQGQLTIVVSGARNALVGMSSIESNPRNLYVLSESFNQTGGRLKALRDKLLNEAVRTPLIAKGVLENEAPNKKLKTALTALSKSTKYRLALFADAIRVAGMELKLEYGKTALADGRTLIDRIRNADASVEDMGDYDALLERIRASAASLYAQIPPYSALDKSFINYNLKKIMKVLQPNRS